MCIDRQNDGRTDRRDEGKRGFVTMRMANIKGIKGLTLDPVVCNLFQGAVVRHLLLLDSD